MNDITNSIHINLNIEEMLHQVIGRLGQLMVIDNCHLVLLKDNQTSLNHIFPLKSCELEQDSGWTALHELALLTARNGHWQRNGPTGIAKYIWQ